MCQKEVRVLLSEEKVVQENQLLFNRKRSG